jgi:hypothetical protein
MTAKFRAVFCGKKPIITNSEHAEIYRRHYGVFRELYECNRDLMKELGR